MTGGSYAKASHCLPDQLPCPRWRSIFPAVQFDEPTLPQYIAEQLKAFNVEPRRLLIELTETSAVSDLQDAERFIEALQKTGCTACMDDFGTGFSSFAYLKHLKADVLKIDGLFIRDLPNDRDNQVFVKSIVDVARGLARRRLPNLWKMPKYWKCCNASAWTWCRATIWINHRSIILRLRRGWRPGKKPDYKLQNIQ